MKTLHKSNRLWQSLSGTKAEEITRAIVNMVVQDYMPIRIVEGSGFKNLMSLIAPEYSVPSRNTIKAKNRQSIYDEEKSKLLVELRDVETVALTTDTWTSNSTTSYITCCFYPRFSLRRFHKLF